jgi:hypothetical protein
VPRFRRLPVLGSVFREYSRYLPDLSFRIMFLSLSKYAVWGGNLRTDTCRVGEKGPIFLLALSATSL